MSRETSSAEVGSIQCASSSRNSTGRQAATCTMWSMNAAIVAILRWAGVISGTEGHSSTGSDIRGANSGTNVRAAVLAGVRKASSFSSLVRGGSPAANPAAISR